MRVTRLGIGLTALAGLMLVTTGEARACSCGPSGPPCQNAFQVDAVFAATVRTIVALPDDDEPQIPPGSTRIPRTVRVEFTDVVAYRGIQTPTVSVITAGTGPACGYAFTPGKRYLVYANRTKDGKGLVTGICSRTRLLQDADEDLRFLQTLSTPRKDARLYGTISHSERDPTTTGGGEPRWRRVAVPDVLVAARGPRYTSDAWTDAQGRYELALPPGTYEITASPPSGFSTRYLQQTVELKDARGCFVSDFNVWLDVSIHGVVRHSSGEPAVGVDVEVMAAEDVGKSGYIQTRREATDVAGRFEFSEVAPGRYVVGVDLTNGPKREVVFPRTFYPGTPDAAHATVFQLDTPQRRELERLTLPPARRPRRFTGTVVFEDGSPASGQSVVLRDGSATWSQVGGGRTGSDGTFSIVVHEGLSYVASAVHWDEAQRRQLTGSVGPFFVIGDTGPLKIVLSKETYRTQRQKRTMSR
jgi:hypothetical protein